MTTTLLTPTPKPTSPTSKCYKRGPAGTEAVSSLPGEIVRPLRDLVTFQRSGSKEFTWQPIAHSDLESSISRAPSRKLMQDWSAETRTKAASVQINDRAHDALFAALSKIDDELSSWFEIRSHL